MKVYIKVYSYWVVLTRLSYVRAVFLSGANSVCLMLLFIVYWLLSFLLSIAKLVLTSSEATSAPLSCLMQRFHVEVLSAV